MTYSRPQWNLSVLLLLLGISFNAFAQQSTTALEAIKNRARRTQSLEIEWSGTAFQAASKAAATGVGSNSPTDITFSTAGKLTCDPTGRLRLELREAKWSSEKQAMVPIEQTLALNRGDVQTALSGGGVDYPRHANGGARGVQPAKHVRLLPIRVAYWPFDSFLGVCSESELSNTQQVGTIDDKQCVILRASSGVELWLDPEREYQPLRYRNAPNGVTTLVVDLEYVTRDDESQLQRWKISIFTADGSLKRSYSEAVTACRVNPELRPQEFVIEAQPGAWVRDYNSGERYIVRDDGTKRPVGRGEFTGDNYEELKRTDPSSGETSVNWTWYFAAGLTAILLIYLYARRR